MDHKIKYIFFILYLPFTLLGQEQDTIKIKKTLEEVNVNAIRANDKTPITFTNINKKEIERNNLGQDLPYLLSLSPSIVTT